MRGGLPTRDTGGRWLRTLRAEAERERLARLHARTRAALGVHNTNTVTMDEAEADFQRQQAEVAELQAELQQQQREVAEQQQQLRLLEALRQRKLVEARAWARVCHPRARHARASLLLLPLACASRPRATRPRAHRGDVAGGCHAPGEPPGPAAQGGGAQPATHRGDAQAGE